MIFKLGELFCGPGGLAWGATHADIGDPNFRIVHEWANDYDENTCKTYRHNICRDKPGSVYHADVRTFDLTRLKPIDAFAFGFPCNDYSVVGEQKGMDGVYGTFRMLEQKKEYTAMYFYLAFLYNQIILNITYHIYKFLFHFLQFL